MYQAYTIDTCSNIQKQNGRTWYDTVQNTYKLQMLAQAGLLTEERVRATPTSVLRRKGVLVGRQHCVVLACSRPLLTNAKKIMIPDVLKT